VVEIHTSQYKDQAAVTIESQAICAQFLPETGAKLASLIYKPHNFELLVQRPGKKYLVQSFDGVYTDGECSGLDDMFPTIDTCFYDRYPWEGVKMADHGEVWSLPWETTQEEDRLHFSVYGVRFPYRLEKWASIAEEGLLRLDYRLTNLSSFDFGCVWAAHPMFNLEEDTELVLPEGVDSVVGTFGIPDGFVTYGDEYRWPVGAFMDGVSRDFRKLRPKATREAYKYYIKGKMPAGWCGLKYHRQKFTFAMSFPVKQVPYLGILPNEGGWQDLYNIFLEPCTAPFDRPDAARYRGQDFTLQASSSFSWHLNLTLAEGTAYKRAHEDGSLE
jgi:galactose mutarotase-like enzyme